MILKMPCKIGDNYVQCIVRRDAINFIQPLEDGNKCRMYVNMIATPLEVRVPFARVASFMANAHLEGVRDLKDTPIQSSEEILEKK